MDEQLPSSGIDDAIITDDLTRRPCRDRDIAGEANALSRLARGLSDQPEQLLQLLTDAVVQLGVGGSAGVSLRKDQGFAWEAISGAWSRYRGNQVPFDASPCGVAFAHDQTKLFAKPGLVFDSHTISPVSEELLVVPFHAQGETVGTLWASSHHGNRSFDQEDARLLQRLSAFASAAFQMSKLVEMQQKKSIELKENASLLKATMDASMDMIQVFEAVRDDDGDIVDFRWLLINPTSLRYYGEDVTGRLLLENNPGVVDVGIFDTFKRVVETGQPHQTERNYNHEQFVGWFYQSTVKLGDGVATTTSDITPLKLAEAQVRELEEHALQAKLNLTEERIRLFGEASADVLWMRDAQTLQWIYLTPAFETIYGLTREQAVSGNHWNNWLDLIVEEDRDVVIACIDAVRSGQRVDFEFRIRRPDGELRWIRNTDFPVGTGDAETVMTIGGIGRDITALKAAQERQDLLLAELQHRVRNVIAVIRSVVRRSAENATSVEDYAQHLEGRINALARTQSMLTRAVGAGVDLELLVLDEMQSQAAGSDQYRVLGEDILLAPKAAEVLTLAIHELATNSTKYGALSNEHGRSCQTNVAGGAARC